jgi:hypothetical protein
MLSLLIYDFYFRRTNGFDCILNCVALFTFQFLFSLY